MQHRNSNSWTCDCCQGEQPQAEEGWIGAGGDAICQECWEEECAASYWKFLDESPAPKRKSSLVLAVGLGLLCSWLLSEIVWKWMGGPNG